MYLLDTNVISEQRKFKPHGAVLAWFASVDATDLYISAITIAEIQAGIERTYAVDPPKSLEIEAWLDAVVRTFQVLPMDAEIARRWARMMHGRQDHASADCWIAATAMAYEYIVVTRNVRDFAKLGVELLNPFRTT